MVFDRSGGIGGSDVPAILGVSPYASPIDVWMEKVQHPAWRPKDVSPEMRFGTLLEPIMRSAYMEDTGRRVHAPGDKTYWADDRIRYAHLDGLVESEGIWEGKAPFQTWRNWKDGPPVYVHAQIQHYMDITGEPWCDVSALAAGLDPIFQTYRVDSDPGTQANIRTAVLRFWHEYVETGQPPERLPANLEWPSNAGDLMVVASDEDEALVDRLARIKKQALPGLAAEEEELKEELKRRIGQAAGMTGSGWRIRWKKNRDSEVTDWKLVAGVYRQMLDVLLAGTQPTTPEAEHVLTDGPDPATIIGLYTEVRPGARPFNLDIEEST